MLALGLSRAEAKAIGRRYGQNALVWIGADAFYTWWDNMQADTLRPDGLIATRNAGYARIVGIEATLSHAFGPVWRITLWAIAQAALLIRHGLGIRVGGCPGGLHLGVREIGPARLSFDPALDRPMGNLIESEIGACVVGADAVVLIRFLPGTCGGRVAMASWQRRAVPGPGCAAHITQPPNVGMSRRRLAIRRRWRGGSGWRPPESR